MSLVICVDCDHEVSTLANVCPRCGRPMQQEIPQIIEKTAKRWKGLKIIGFVVFLVGIMVAVSGFANESMNVGIAGGTLIFIGLTVVLVAAVASWWYHG